MKKLKFGASSYPLKSNQHKMLEGKDNIGLITFVALGIFLGAQQTLQKFTLVS